AAIMASRVAGLRTGLRPRPSCIPRYRRDALGAHALTPENGHMAINAAGGSNSRSCLPTAAAKTNRQRKATCCGVPCAASQRTNWLWSFAVKFIHGLILALLSTYHRLEQ